MTRRKRSGSATQFYRKRRSSAKSAPVAERTDAEIGLAQLSAEHAGLEDTSGEAVLKTLHHGPEGAFGSDPIENQAALLGEFRLPALQRQVLAAEIGRMQGNQHLQSVVASLGSLAGTASSRAGKQPPATAVARSAVSEAQQRAGTSRQGTWPGITESAYEHIMGIVDRTHISRVDQRAVLEYLARELGLPVGSRITLAISEQIGSRDGLATPYVEATPECSSARPDRHREIHRGAVKAHIEINPRVFRRRVPRHRMTLLYSTLMHEYTHFLQATASQTYAQTVFMPTENRRLRARLGDIELVRSAGGGQESLIEALDEIDAYASEIENTRRTGLNISFDIRQVASNLWENYVRYRNRVGADRVDAAVAIRVHNNIQRARRMLRWYLTAEEHREEVRRVYPRASMLQWLLDNCPEERLGLRYTTAAVQAEIARARARAGTGS